MALVGGYAVFAFYRRSRKSRYALRGKSVVITGGSRGLGLALAEICLARGASVSLLARDLDELARAKQHLACSYPVDRIATVPCDVSDSTSIRSAFEKLSATSRIDVLINNAGVIQVGPMEEHNPDTYHEAMSINLFGAVHSVYQVLPQMLERRHGQIVNIASIGGLVAVPHLLPYTTSKFALVGFSRGLSAELGAKGIKVLTVCPWLIRTGSHLKAQFTGKAAAEYQWFSAGATLPIISVSAQATSRAIADAIESGRGELLVSVWSHLAAFAAQSAPSFTGSLLSTVNRFLPSTNGVEGKQPLSGLVFEDSSPAFLRRLGSAAATRWNQ